MRAITKVITGAVIAVGAFFALNAPINSSVDARDYSSNAVVKGGTYSVGEAQNAYNSDASTRNIFNHYGLNAQILGGQVKDGYVTKDGKVTVGGDVVATNAMTAGRQYIAGSSKQVANGTTFYARTPSVSFRSSQLSAFVFVDAQGRFVGAIVKDCGNPVSATPTPQPEIPFNPGIPGKVPQPEAAYTCDSLAATKISRTEFRFNAAATGTNGATVRDYTYNFGDGATQTTGAQVNHTYAAAGTYTATATANFTTPQGDKTATSAACKVTITVENEQVPTYTCDSLAATKISRTEFRFNAAATGTNGATVRDYTYNFGDGATQTTGAQVNHTYAAAGTYTATVTANFTTPQGVKTATGASCKVTVTVEKEYVDACNTETGVIEQVEKGKENTAPHTTDMSKCADVKVCDTTTGNIITVPKKDQNKPEYADVNSDKCKVKVCLIETGETISVDKKDENDAKYAPVGSDKCKVQVCEVETGEIITVDKKDQHKPGYADKDSDKCKETPPTPPVTPTPVTPAPESPTPAALPQTGMADVLSGVLGLGAMTTAGWYYLGTRRNG